VGTTFTHYFHLRAGDAVRHSRSGRHDSGLPRRHRGLHAATSLKVGAYAVSIAFFVLLFFIAGGQLLLEALHIPMPSFQLRGSIVLLLFGLKLVLGKVTEEAASHSAGTSMYERRSIRLAIPGSPAPAHADRWCC
jgi:small neutral amino acid transporter SnatA (MarC family)